jgi:hypothetical protein
VKVIVEPDTLDGAKVACGAQVVPAAILATLAVTVPVGVTPVGKVKVSTKFPPNTEARVLAPVVLSQDAYGERDIAA